jgi:5-methylcytosine-specific restriction endonuclease McrA
MNKTTLQNPSSNVKLSPAKRRMILKYFKNECYVCGYRHFLDIHHIKHKRNGGKNTLENCVVLCPNHHKEWHYIENTYFRDCTKSNKERLSGGRDAKAFGMCIKEVRDVFELNKEPYIEVIDKYGKSNR